MTDGTRKLKSEGPIELLEYINIDSPGYLPGDYVLQIVAVGHTFGTSFSKAIDPAIKTFKDTQQRVFELKL